MTTARSIASHAIQSTRRGPLRLVAMQVHHLTALVVMLPGACAGSSHVATGDSFAGDASGAAVPPVAAIEHEIPAPAKRSGTSLVNDHLRTFFAGHVAETRSWPHGPMAAHPEFRVLEFAPGPRSALWSYVSLGASDLAAPNAAELEFVLCCAERSDRAVELVTMAAHYHSLQGLGTGHTLPIGEAWLPESACDHLLVSLPYPFGPELEVVPGGSGNRRVLWLLPVTQAERDYKARHGMAALEERFDAQALKYWDPRRASVVARGDR